MSPCDEDQRKKESAILYEEERMSDSVHEASHFEDGPQRPVAYVISAVEGFVDEATVRRYGELTGPAIKHFGGHFIVSNSELAIVEGDSPTCHLSMVEFPSIEDARGYYDSPEYAEARALTHAAFRGRVLMFVEGI
jgi:uncharacterized protein (DUF1330 family)